MKIYLLGAANPETIRMIKSVEKFIPNVSFGFLDNDKNKKGQNFFSYTIEGGIEIIPELIEKNGSKEIGFVNLITGDLVARYETSCEIVSLGGRLVNFIHQSVDLTMVEVGVGNYIQENVITQANVKIGDNSSIHMGALIGHESRIGNTVFIAHGVSISGCCEIGDGTFIGTNATILPRIKIGKWATIGAGAVINKNIPDYAVAVGNPARIIKYNEIKYKHASIFGIVK